jgi:hypothetical protein
MSALVLMSSTRRTTIFFILVPLSGRGYWVGVTGLGLLHAAGGVDVGAGLDVLQPPSNNLIHLPPPPWLVGFLVRFGFLKLSIV